MKTHSTGKVLMLFAILEVLFGVSVSCFAKNEIHLDLPDQIEYHASSLFFLNSLSESNPTVIYVNPNKSKLKPPILFPDNRSTDISVDPLLEKEYGLEKIGVQVAWQKTVGSESVVVAVLDSGIDYNHEDISQNLWRNPNPSSELNDIIGYDFVNRDGLPYDDQRHGTHCAGIIGAVGDNGKGITGINKKVSIMALKVLDETGQGDISAAIRAIDYAIQNGAKIINMSWSFNPGSTEALAFERAIQRALEKGVLIIAAAGNITSDNDQRPVYPASIQSENIVAVAATDQDDYLAKFSNFGRKSVHLAAPGFRIWSTLPENRYGSISGTSQASPMVAGAAALIWAKHPDWDFRQVKDLLLRSVERPAELSDKLITGGRLSLRHVFED